MEERRCLVDEVALLDVGDERQVGIAGGDAFAKRPPSEIGP